MYQQQTINRLSKPTGITYLPLKKTLHRTVKWYGSELKALSSKSIKKLKFERVINRKEISILMGHFHKRSIKPLSADASVLNYNLE